MANTRKTTKSMSNILLVSLSASVMMFSGCTSSFKSITDSLTTELAGNKKYPVNETLEIPEVMGLSDITAIALEWKVEFTGDVDGYRVYRAKYGKGRPQFKLIRQFNDRYVKHYVNAHLEPNTTYLYKMTTIKNGQESLACEPVKIKTKKMPDPISELVAYSGMAKSVKVMWRPSKDPRVTGYMVEKYNSTYRKWEELKLIRNRLAPEYIDNDLEDGTVYKYRIRSVIENAKVYGSPSKEVHAKTKDIPPTIENVNMKSHPQQVILTWDVADIDDAEYYSIYRSEDWQYVNDVVLFKKLIGKTKDTTYIDKLQNMNDKEFYYMITVTDIDGLESKPQRPAIIGHTLKRPSAPVAKKLKYEDGRVKINLQSTDQRDEHYKVIKKINKKWFIFENKTANFEGLSFVDGGIDPQYTYEYSFVSVDKNGIESNPTKPIYFDPKEYK